MWMNNRYVATRDPSRGGLQITAATRDFSDEIGKEIYDNCLEMIAKDYSHNCLGVYPLKNGMYSIAMAKKFRGSDKESRPHDMVRGVIADEKELLTFCEEYIPGNIAGDIFFPGEVDSNYPENWSFPERKGLPAGNILRKFWEKRDYKDILGFFNAVEKVIEKKLKIQLIVPDETEEITLAACLGMASRAGGRLFVVANGECTLRAPDIIIIDQLYYLDPRKYRKMTLEEFIRMGSSMVGGSEGEEKNDRDLWQEDLLRLCEEYITSEKVSDQELYEELGRLMTQDVGAYSCFKRSLKRKLFHLSYGKCHIQSFMKLLYIAYKKEHPDMSETPELETAPYDFEGMYVFLKKKSRSKREQKRLLTAMLEVQFSECAGDFMEESAHEAGIHVIDQI